MTAEPGFPSGDVDLGAQVQRALGWSVAGQVALRVASFLSGVLLARILVPEDLGVYAVALAAMTILVSVNDMGVVLGIVRWEGDLDDATPTGFTLSMVSSSLLFLVALVAAGPIAGLMGNPTAAGLTRLLSVVVLIDGLVAVPLGGLVRTFRQDVLAKAEIASIPISVVVSIGLAWAGAGAWSLAIGRIIGALVSAGLFLMASEIKVRFGWDRDVSRQLLMFGLPLAGTTLVEELLLNLDYFILGAVLGAEMLGLYVIAYNLATWPISIMREGIRRVSIAGFSRLTDDRQRLDTQFARSVGYLVTGALPLCLGLSILGQPVIRLLYGSEYVLAATALVVLAYLGLSRLFLGLSFDLLIALGRSRTTLYLQLAWLAVLAPALYVATTRTDSLRGPAVAHIVVSFLVVVPAYLFALHRQGIHIGRMARTLVRPLAAGVVAAAIMLAGRLLFERPLVELAVGAIGGLVYILLVAPYAEVGEWWDRRRNRGEAPERAGESDAGDADDEDPDGGVGWPDSTWP
jgi:PST family polysaccharide transporter